MRLWVALWLNRLALAIGRLAWRIGDVHPPTKEELDRFLAWVDDDRKGRPRAG